MNQPDPAETRLGTTRWSRWRPQFGWDTQQRSSTWVRVYYEWRDWWVGVYRGPNHWYICPLPTVVIRVVNKRARGQWKGFGFTETWPFEDMQEETIYG